jgi:hypothetical protein
MMDRCDQIETRTFFRSAMNEMPTVAEMMMKRYRHGDLESCAGRTILHQLGREHVPEDHAPNNHQRAQKIIESESQEPAPHRWWMDF